MQKRNGSKEAGVLLATSFLALVLIAPMGASAALDGGSTMAVKSTHSDGFYGHAGMVVPPKDSSSSPEESLEAKFYLMRVSGLATGVPYTMRSYDKNGTLMSTSSENTTDGDGRASYSFLRTRNKTPDVLPVSLEIDIEGKTYRIGYTKPTSKKNDVLALSSKLEGGKLVQQF